MELMSEDRAGGRFTGFQFLVSVSHMWELRTGLFNVSFLRWRGGDLTATTRGMAGAVGTGAQRLHLA